MKEKLLSTREVSTILGIPENEVIKLAEKNLIPHFRVAGEFLRFKKDDALKIKSAVRKKYNLPDKRYGPRIETIKEFLYFNDFYIVSMIIIFILMWVIVKDIAFGA